MLHTKVTVRERLKRILLKTLKITGWIVLSVILLFVVAIFAIRLPSVQNKITQRAITYLQDKIGTPVTLSNIYISFPKKVVIENLYVESQSKDTLLFVGRLTVDTDLWGLTKNRIELNSVCLENSRASVTRAKNDSSFNFTYIIDAFATDSTAVAEPKDTTATAWQFILDEVTIKQTRLSFHDALIGMNADASIGELEVDMNEFDLNKSIYRADDISLSNSTIAYLDTAPAITATDKVTPASEEADSLLLDIGFNSITFSNLKLHYEQEATNQYAIAKLGELIIKANEISLAKKKIDLRSIEMNKSLLTYRTGAARDTIKTVVKEIEKITNDSLTFAFSIPWNISLSKLTLQDNGIQYYKRGMSTSRGMDFNNLWIFGLQLSASNLKAAGTDVTADIDNITFQEQSGFLLKSFVTDFSLSDKELSIARFFMETADSKINLSADAAYPSLATLMTNFDQSTFNIQVKPTVLALHDFLYFAPLPDSLPVRLSSSEKIQLTASAKGKLSDFSMSNLTVKAFDSTFLSMNGKVKGLPDTDKATMNITLKKFYTTAADVKKVATDSLIPSSIELPRWVQLTGSATGTINTPKANLLLTSSDGTLKANATLDVKRKSYKGTVETDKLHLGSILKQSAMGTLNMRASVNGSGYTLEEMNSSADILVSRFDYSGYEYKDFKLNGTLKKYFFSGKASLEDKNLDFVLSGDLDYAGDEPVYKFTFDLKNANFHELHLSQRQLKARGAIDVNLTMADFKKINGDLSIRKFAIFNGEKLYMVDSLLFVSVDQEGLSTVSIKSNILSGDFKGSINIFKLPETLRQHMNQYFSLQDKKITPFETRQYFNFDLTLKDTDLLTEILLPDLQPFVPGKITGEFDSEKNILNVEVGLSKLTYATTSVDSLSIRIDSDADAFNYRLRLKNLSIDTLTVDALQTTGRIENDSIYAALQILNARDEKKYELGGVIKSEKDHFSFHFLKDQVLLNYTPWNVPDDNSLQFGAKGLTAHNFTISNEKEKIGVTTEAKDSTVSIEFQQVELFNLTRLVRGVVPASGRLDGNFKFTTASSGQFNSTLKITDLYLLEKAWGNITFALSHAQSRYTVHLVANNKQSVLKANGYVTSAEEAAFDLSVDLAPLDMQMIEPFTFGQLRNMKGIATGNLKVSGTVKDPSIRGSVTFKDAEFNSTYVNNTFKLTNETFAFREQGIVLNNFTVRDANDNKASINGSILTKAYREFEFNLQATSRNFQVLNTTADNNSLYYGKVKLNMDARITGFATQPKVVLRLSMSDDSNLTYVVPQSQKSVLEQKGIVRFVDKDAYRDPFLADLNLADTVTSQFAGIDLTANLELRGKETLNIVIDPITDDRLSVKGTSTLTLNIEPSGAMSLSGRYEINEGSYRLSFQKLMKREFTIEKGSSIIWSGDPLNAAMSVTANYKVETSPLDLIANQTSAMTQTEMNTYRQRLPFLVKLNIRGQLLAPEISFSLDMPMDKRNAFGGAVYAKILDVNSRESDVNKQVFALLILKRFISENPLESQAGSDVANTTRTSVSRLLSDQLNRLSENIKGVELSVDIKSFEDYSTGQAQGDTRVQLGLSKTLFGDRLVVKLSGNVDVEGEGTNSGKASDYIGDIALEYKLTSDGRFRITGFRTGNFDMIDGELIETGAGLIYIKDYNTLNELFKRNVSEN